MSDQVDLGTLLKRVDSLEGEIGRLKRDLLRSLVVQPRGKKVKSLFGSVQSGDVTEEMIEEAKRTLFRPLEDL
ncbi:hypothetical protein KAX17_15785 [Candidatus Bipolaricaulota bacterium]|nr:hypothetical protein [Candidatus Bipolaricaulota bacterium]